MKEKTKPWKTKNSSVSGQEKEYSQLHKMDEVLLSLAISVERAEVLAQDLTDDYFAIDVTNKAEMWKIQASHHEHGIRAEIVFDYLHKMEKDIEAAMKLVNAEFAKRRESEVA